MSLFFCFICNLYVSTQIGRILFVFSLFLLIRASALYTYWLSSMHFYESCLFNSCFENMHVWWFTVSYLVATRNRDLSMMDFIFVGFVLLEPPFFFLSYNVFTTPLMIMSMVLHVFFYKFCRFRYACPQVQSIFSKLPLPWNFFTGCWCSMSGKKWSCLTELVGVCNSCGRLCYS